MQVINVINGKMLKYMGVINSGRLLSFTTDLVTQVSTASEFP